MSCGVGCRRGSVLVLLWLWHRPAAALLIRPLAWEPPYAVGVGLRKKKKNLGVPIVAQGLTNPTRTHEVAGSVPALAQWVNGPALL